jgi:RNA polymerase sigma-70 factor (sigma-E family)
MDRVSAIVGSETEERGTGADADAAVPSAGGLEDLYVRHAPEAVRLAYLLTNDGALAEDLAQEAFIKVAGRFRHLRDANALDAYLRRTVVNLCMSHHRRRRVERDYLTREARAPASVDPPDVGARDELRAALATLPMRQRAAVVLRYYRDLPEQQVAQALGCSVTAARSLVFRAMETLRIQISRGDDT